MSEFEDKVSEILESMHLWANSLQERVNLLQESVERLNEKIAELEAGVQKIKKEDMDLLTGPTIRDINKRACVEKENTAD